MTLEITSATGRKHVNPITDASKTQVETTEKALRVYEKNIRNPAEAPVESERDFYISKLMKEKGVTQEVAAAEYDFWT